MPTKRILEKPKRRTLDSGKGLILRSIRAFEMISRVELSRVVEFNRSTISQLVNPLIESGLIEESVQIGTGMGRPPVLLSLRKGKDSFIGLNLGVNHSQIGVTGFDPDYSDIEEFVTPKDPKDACTLLAEKIAERLPALEEEKLRSICITVPGPVDKNRRTLVVAPHLGWKSVDVADLIERHPVIKESGVSVVIENNASASAIFETRRMLAVDKSLTDYIVVRSGTGVGVGIIRRGDAFRGYGSGQGFAGEFGHMTIAAGGRDCVCGNKGCWETYASAPAALRLYKEILPEETKHELRFSEIAALANSGDRQAISTLEKMGDYLGIGIANTMLGVGIPNVIVSGRLTYGWKHMSKNLNEAIERSMAGKLSGWSIKRGARSGGSVGGALEVAVNDYFSRVDMK